MIQIIEKISKENVIDKEIVTISINSLFSILKGLKNCDSISYEIIYSIGTKLDNNIKKIVQKLFDEYFEDLMKFLNMNNQQKINLK